jgi:hypothetical protein
MVSARARARTLVAYSALESAFQERRFRRRFDPREHDTALRFVQDRLPLLSPATRRMLDAVYAALALSDEPAGAYGFCASVNRAAIAEALGKLRLIPYDVAMLRKLATLGLVLEGDFPLPVKTLIGADGQPLQLGAGHEFRYGIPKNVLYALIVLGNPAAFPVEPTAPVRYPTLAEPLPRRRAPLLDGWARRYLLICLVIGVLAAAGVFVALKLLTG